MSACASTDRDGETASAGVRLEARLSRLARVGAHGADPGGVLVAVLMLGNYDTRFETTIASDLPSFDAQGRIRLVDFGEGEYVAKERAIRSLLAEAGAARLASPAGEAGRGRRAPRCGPRRGDRLYRLVSLPGVQTHTLTVKVPAGVSAYDFTFG